ncbi:RNA-guided endonuclease InsQ/TnpB family protein [Kitasatospora purpeofusca]|uniref:RNA-guided endonuclease InsQ/TnpB family protein n=1 Tax=Kitasatospora purpeofusca TaxID=67352 RepID=UPI00386523F5|nr:RNA-guided endonuclease TnpB family protein [Kitasatospora purpeofusca]
MIRAYKFLVRPTVGQAQALGEMLRDHCSLYNGALQERRDAYRHVSRTSVKYGMQSAQLKEIRAFDPECQGPRHGRIAAAKLEAAQQALSRFPRVRRDKRTGNHRRAVEKVAELHGKVRRQRLDHAHKTALALVREHDFIAHEDLRIRNMSRSVAPRTDPGTPGVFLPNGAAAKAGLNRSIMDAGWGVFLTILTSKAESAGRVVVAVDPRNTSRTCPECGHTAKENRPTQEKFHCRSCGHTAHADTVGAINVLRAGPVRREAHPA